MKFGRSDPQERDFLVFLGQDFLNILNSEERIMEYLCLLAQTSLEIRSETGYAVGWFTLSLLNAGLAQAKNRSGLLWWLISLVLGPIATFLLVAFCRKLPESLG